MAGHMKYHCRPPKCLWRATRVTHSSKSPWSRSHPSWSPLMLAVMTPDAISSSQYVEIQRIPVGPDLAPRRMNPFRASRFKFSFNPSCKQTRSRGLRIRSSFWSAQPALVRLWRLPPRSRPQDGKHPTRWLRPGTAMPMGTALNFPRAQLSVLGAAFPHVRYLRKCRSSEKSHKKAPAPVLSFRRVNKFGAGLSVRETCDGQEICADDAGLRRQDAAVKVGDNGKSFATSRRYKLIMLLYRRDLSVPAALIGSDTNWGRLSWRRRVDKVRMVRSWHERDLPAPLTNVRSWG